MNWPTGLRKTLRLVLTIVLVIAAIVAVAQIWDHYMHDPWTRDGRVRADVVNLGTDVAGLVDSLEVHDNQRVQKGDVLFTIDQQRYQLALDEARANLNQLEQQRDEAQAANSRRQRLKNYVSQEDKDNARFALTTAQAASTVGVVTLRLSDDSPEDGEGGAILYSERIIVEDVRGNKYDSAEIGFAANRDGGTIINGFPTANGGESITLEYDLRQFALVLPTTVDSLT